MTKKFLLKSLLLLCALVAGSGSVWAEDTYQRITNTSDLEVGAQYIIVSETNTVAMGTVSSDKGQGVAVTFDSGKITLASTSTVNILTLGGSSDGYTLFGNQDSKYIGYNSSTKLAASTSASTNSYKWTITFSGNDASIANVASATRLIRAYDNNKDFRAYTTSNGSNVQLYKKITASGPIDPTVTISSEKITKGSTASISGPEGLSLSFTSSNPSVAAVNAEGIVSGVAVGTATITATWAAVEDTYNAGSKEFSVTVIEATVYEEVTSTDQIAAGREYILVATEHNVAMGAQNDKIRRYVGVTVANNKVTITSENVAVLTLGGTEDAWTFLASDNSKYLALTSNSNEVHTSTDATASASKWTITDDFQLKSTAQTDTRYLRYNSGSPRFACYKSGQATAVLFVKVTSEVTETVSVGTKGFATLVSDYALDFTGKSIKAYTINSADGSKLTLTQKDKVAKNEPVLLYSTTASDSQEIPVIAESEATVDGANKLVAGTGAALTWSESEKYYILYTGGEAPGFYRANASPVAVGKAYLDLTSVGASARSFSLNFDDEATGISALLKAEERADNKVYNLNGQRVAQPQKGLYIINGKKVMVK